MTYEELAKTMGPDGPLRVRVYYSVFPIVPEDETPILRVNHIADGPDLRISKLSGEAAAHFNAAIATLVTRAGRVQELQQRVVDLELKREGAQLLNDGPSAEFYDGKIEGLTAELDFYLEKFEDWEPSSNPVDDGEEDD